jgi:predicted dehydrogenase
VEDKSGSTIGVGLLGMGSMGRAHSSAFRRIEVTDAAHPFVAQWWPRHPLGWDQTFVHEIGCLLDAIEGRGTVAPYGATFDDGYRAAVICDAIAASAEKGAPVAIQYAP